jgi:hypothetical protein
MSRATNQRALMAKYTAKISFYHAIAVKVGSQPLLHQELDVWPNRNK